jgi:hypothetical protein
VCGFYIASQREVGLSWRRQLRYLPFLMSLGIGLSVNNARAVFEALWNHNNVFTRTPKLGVGHGGGESDKAWARKLYRGDWLKLQPLIEVGLGLYVSGAVAYVIANHLWASLPFLVLSQVGFLYVGLMSLFQGRGIFRRRADELAAATPGIAQAS